jgi:hypothetical protein
LKDGEKLINILKFTLVISTYKAVETRDEKRQVQGSRNQCYIVHHSPAKVNKLGNVYTGDI